MMNPITASVHRKLMYIYVALTVTFQVLYFVISATRLPGNIVVRAMPDQSLILIVFTLIGYGFTSWSGMRRLMRSVQRSGLSIVLSPIIAAVLWVILWSLLRIRREELFGTLPSTTANIADMAYGLMIVLGPFLLLAVWHGFCWKIE